MVNRHWLLMFINQQDHSVCGPCAERIYYSYMLPSLHLPTTPHPHPLISFQEVRQRISMQSPDLMVRGRMSYLASETQECVFPCYIHKTQITS